MKYNKVPLGDLITVLTDYHANGAYQKLKENVELLDDEDYALMVRTTNFESNDFSDSLKFISEHAYNFLEKSKVYGGDLIMNKIANAGSIYLMPDLKRPVSLAMNLFLIRVDEQKANPVYVYIFLKINEAYVKQFANGSVTKTITKDAVRNLEISLPPREVQNEIANQYNSLSKKIAVNSRINKILEEMAQAIFKSWFVDFDPVKAKMNGEQPEGMDAATASLFPEKLVESELGLIPEGWPVDQVGNHIDVTKGKSYKSAELQESTTALVTLKSFKRGGGYRMDGLKEYTGKYKPQQVIEAGDLVMSLTDVTQAAEIVGKPALVIDAPQYDTLVASLDVAILRPKETDAKQYFYGLMSTYRFHRYAESFATGTTVLHLSPKGITTFEFACPSAELVKKYHEFAAPIFAKIEANILESQELAKLRDTLLPKLLSGEIELGQAQELAEVE
ncbi:restriction endonuclease subunit S [Vibrio olivae]|uniref:Restriction endonuclease subunit S n=1 Tax=Vibrio olivae TaxID=1243002 RepID=A0ABV5HML9_9VIBR